MGRLENFIPLTQKLKFVQRDGLQYVLAPGLQPQEVPYNTVPFFEQLGGHLSLREIFLFLTRKNISIAIGPTLEVLAEMANKGYFTNSEEFLKIYNGQEGEEGAKAQPHLQDLKPSYFSHERLIALLQKTTLFMKCERSVAEKILRHAELDYVPENTRLIKKGSKSRHFYVLLAGGVGVYRLGNLLVNLTPLSVFGESAAIFNKERNADVSTTAPSWLLKVDAPAILGVEDDEGLDMMNSLKSRLILNQTLAANPLFGKVPTDVLQLFLSKCHIEKHAKEQEVIKQGNLAGNFYFILRGSVAVVKDGLPVTSLAEGNHFGEVSAVFQQPCNASIITESECVFLTIHHQAFLEVLCSHFRLAQDIEKTAAERNSSQENIFTKIAEEFTASGILQPESVTNSEIMSDELIEVTETNYDMRVLDFTKDTGNPLFQLAEDDEDEAS